MVQLKILRDLYYILMRLHYHYIYSNPQSYSTGDRHGIFPKESKQGITYESKTTK